MPIILLPYAAILVRRMLAAAPLRHRHYLCVGTPNAHAISPLVPTSPKGCAAGCVGVWAARAGGVRVVGWGVAACGWWGRGGSGCGGVLHAPAAICCYPRLTTTPSATTPAHAMSPRWLSRLLTCLPACSYALCARETAAACRPRVHGTPRSAAICCTCAVRTRIGREGSGVGSTWGSACPGVTPNARRSSLGNFSSTQQNCVVCVKCNV